MNTNTKIIVMSEVKEEAVEWLWYPYIPYGKLTIIQGDPGDGKTTLILNIAAKLSRGECLEKDAAPQEPINVIYQTAEDGLADTIKPRLVKANADCDRIFVIDESEHSLSMDDERLKEAIITHHAKLLVLDPLQAYLGGRVDMNKANEVRDMTKKLARIAEQTKCAIVLIGHMNKSVASKAAYRSIGSVDLFAVVRSVLLVGRIAGLPTYRAVVAVKNNLAIEGTSKAFELIDDKFVWHGNYEISADEVLGGYKKEKKSNLAKQLLWDLAKDNDFMKSTEIYAIAKSKKISSRTLEVAKTELSIKAKREGNSWYWDLSSIR